MPGCSQSVVRRAGAAILEAVARGESLPEAELPVYRPAPRPACSAAVRRRAEALRAWRTKAAKEIGLDPGVLFPQRLIDRLAAAPPPTWRWPRAGRGRPPLARELRRRSSLARARLRRPS